MKIGLFISGEVRHDIDTVIRNIELLQEGFSTDDTVFGAWTHQQKEYGDLFRNLHQLVLLNEPVMHYDPYIDNPNAIDDYQYQKKLNNPNPRHEHQTKQILIHNHMMRQFGQDYDVIVRARWDTTVSPLVNFVPYAREAMRTPCVTTMTTRKDFHTSMLTVGNRASWLDPYLAHGLDKVHVSRTTEMLLDSGIVIHPSNIWDCDLVDSLHKNKKLLAAEFGWYQVLVTDRVKKQWVHYDGGASLTRSIIKSDRNKIDEILRYYN